LGGRKKNSQLHLMGKKTRGSGVDQAHAHAKIWRAAGTKPIGIENPAEAGNNLGEGSSTAERGGRAGHGGFCLKGRNVRKNKETLSLRTGVFGLGKTAARQR